MNFTGLPARIVYAIVALPLGAVAGFFVGIPLFSKLSPIFHDPHPSMSGFGVLKMAVALGEICGTTAFVVALTLPWLRPSKARWRIARSILSGVILMLAFLSLVGQGHALILVLVFTVWLTAAFYFTFVSKGVIDSSSDLTQQDIGK